MLGVKRMKKKTRKKTPNKKCKVDFKCHTSGGALYFLGFVGALVYYVSTAPDFWAAVIGFFKAIVWPAFLVFGLLKQIGL